jgi:hypothetical protein
MRYIPLISAAALFLFVSPSPAQDDDNGDAAPAAQEQAAPESTPQRAHRAAGAPMRAKQASPARVADSPAPASEEASSHDNATIAEPTQGNGGAGIGHFTPMQNTTGQSGRSDQSGSGGGGGSDAGSNAPAAKLALIQWPDSLQEKLVFPMDGRGYTWKFAPWKDVSDRWSWVGTAQTRKGCRYTAFISEDPAGRKLVGPAQIGATTMGNLPWCTTKGCALKAGQPYYMNIFLKETHGENPATMIAVGKVLCELWLGTSGHSSPPSQ